MADAKPFTAVTAHRLLNAVSAIEGLIISARYLRAHDRHRTEVDAVLDAAQQRAFEVAAELTELVRGLPEVHDLDDRRAGSSRREPPPPVPG